jgi:hypothetical protein
MWNTWVYQKVPRLSSTDRKKMALGEYLRYDWEIGTLPLGVPSGFAVWTSGVAQHECQSPPCFVTFAISAWTWNWSSEPTSNSASDSANLERRLLKCYDVRMGMWPCVVRRVSSGMRASREAEHHLKTTRGQGDLPRAQRIERNGDDSPKGDSFS